MIASASFLKLPYYLKVLLLTLMATSYLLIVQLVFYDLFSSSSWTSPSASPSISGQALPLFLYPVSSDGENDQDDTIGGQRLLLTRQASRFLSLAKEGEKVRESNESEEEEVEFLSASFHSSSPSFSIFSPTFSSAIQGDDPYQSFHSIVQVNPSPSDGGFREARIKMR